MNFLSEFDNFFSCNPLENYRNYDYFLIKPHNLMLNFLLLLKKLKENSNYYRMGSIFSLLYRSITGKYALEINDLNDDVLLIIFSYLNLKEKILVSGVCIRWSTLISKLFKCQSSLVLTRHSDLHWQYYCSNRLNIDKIRAYSHLSLPSNNKYDKKVIIEKVISMCTNLKSIDFLDIYFEKNFTPFRIIMNSCESDLIHCNFTHVLNERINSQDVRILITAQEMSQFVNKYPNIRHFAIYDSWFRFTEESLKVLMIGFKDLEFLSLGEQTICDSQNEISGDYFHYINENISVLNITQQILGINGLKILCNRLKSITEFGVNTLSSLNDIKIISEYLIELKCLSFEFSIPAKDQTQAFLMLSQLKNLEELNISMNKEMEFNSIDSDLVIIMSKCHLMKRFRLKGSITDNPIKVIDHYWPKLEKLSIIPTNKDTLTDEVLPRIAKLKNLSHLDVRDSRIGDQLIQVINSCENLHYINVCGSQVTNRLLEAFINVAKANPQSEYQIKRARTNITQKHNDQLLPTNFVVS